MFKEMLAFKYFPPCAEFVATDFCLKHSSNNFIVIFIFLYLAAPVHFQGRFYSPVIPAFHDKIFFPVSGTWLVID